MSALPHLLLTCDDCGLSEGINRAALDLFARGLLTTASIVMNFPAAHHAFALFEQQPGLRCGVHLNLTEGKPLNSPPSSPLVDAQGWFRPREWLYTQALTPSGTFIAAVEAECRAQIEAFCHRGLPLDHLTTHMHFHIMPPLRAVVYQLAADYGVEWVRSGALEAGYLPFNPFWTNRPRPAPVVRTPDHEVPVSAWQSADPFWLAGKLRSLHGMTEIIVHAGIDPDPDFPPLVLLDPAGRAREMHFFERLVPHVL
jgi:hypothetical protein